tara:strand:+ start:1293 stop:2483 length:1191 start_codon:yes stop_codon:yes gene_type:complete
MSKSSCAFCTETYSEDDLFYGMKESARICISCVEKAHIINASTKPVNYANKDSQQSCIKAVTPKAMIDYLNLHVVGQLEVKKRLSMAVYSHIIRVRADDSKASNLPKSNVFLVGDTGTGKTLMLQKLSEFLSIPLVIIDSTTLTQSGYQGEDVNSFVKQLLIKADGDVELAEKGIVFIDEVDKIASKSSQGTLDVSGRSVQQSFLKMVEGRDVEVSTKDIPNIEASKTIINTEKMLFVAGGAFDGMEDITKPSNTIGFSVGGVERNANQISIEDKLKKYGMIPEFLGRFPIKLKLESLTVEDMANILKHVNGGILSAYKALFDEIGIELSVDNSVIEKIATKSHKIGLGARGIQTVLQPVLDDLLFEVSDEISEENVGGARIIYDKNTDSITGSFK